MIHVMFPPGPIRNSKVAKNTVICMMYMWRQFGKNAQNAKSGYIT